VFANVGEERQVPNDKHSDRDRTGAPLLAKIWRTKNQQLTAIASRRLELRQLAKLIQVKCARVAIRHNSAGLMVGTKLGTVLVPVRRFLMNPLTPSETS
jgi:hypothetical protein